MLALFLLLVIVAIVLGIVGVVVKGLLYLLIIGIVVFLGALLLVPCEYGGGPGGPRRGILHRSRDLSLCPCDPLARGPDLPVQPRATVAIYYS